MSERKIVRGLKPVLIEGTNGEFDHCFWLLRMSLEEAIEAFWASVQRHRFRWEIPYDVTILSGALAEFVGAGSESFEGKVFISETANPEWCFASTVDRERSLARLPIVPSAFSGSLARSVEIIDINYFPIASHTLLRFWQRDYRVPRQIVDRWVHRTDRLEAYDGLEHRASIPGDPGFTGRGVKKLDHDKIYALCALSGVDLTDPTFLRGRFVVQDYSNNRSQE